MIFKCYSDGVDYVGGAVPVTIAIGENEACALYGINDDAIFEGSETFQVSLSNSDLPLDPQSSTAVVTIIDDGE